MSARDRAGGAQPAGWRIKLLCMAPYDVVPPRYGGPLRVYNLCRELAREFDVVQFAQQAQRRNISPGLTPVRRQITPTYVALSSRNYVCLALYALTSLRFKCPPVWQSRMLELSAPRWLKARLAEADVVQVEHPWQFGWAYRAIAGAKPVVFAAHNVESALYHAGNIDAPAPLAQRLASVIARQEAFAGTHADHVFASSAGDVETLGRKYGVQPERCTVIPNGVDTGLVTPASAATRRKRRHELGIPDRPVVVFVGSQHPPNVEAAAQILNWASQTDLQAVHFAIVGSVGRAFSGVRRHNLTITGLVEQTLPYLEAADIAINPMLTGSGTNLKQLEYMAMGLPSIVTPVGARGIPIVDGQSGLLRPSEDFPAALLSLLDQPRLQAALGGAGRALVERHFSWEAIGAEMRNALRTVCGTTNP